MLELTMIREIEDGTERYEAAIALFEQARRDAGIRAEQNLEDCGVSLQDAAERVDDCWGVERATA